MKILQIEWWKWLSVVILLYVILYGLGIPLKPGIYEVTPFKAKTGQAVTLHIKGYNTDWQAQAAPTAYLKLTTPTKGDNQAQAIEAQAVKVNADQSLDATFQLPAGLPNASVVTTPTLLVSSTTSGTAILPTAISISNEHSTSYDWPYIGLELVFKHDFAYPYRNILNESLRNTFYHIPMWFGMMLLFGGSLYYSIRLLLISRKGNLNYTSGLTTLETLDIKAVALAQGGMLLGILGYLTGMIWARVTWGAYITNDIKLTMAAVCLFIYSAYFLLRASVDQVDKRMRISAVYNVFAYLAMIPLLFIIPRVYSSLHPGNGGNPALGGEDMDNTMRMVFYPAIIGWTLLGLWLSQLKGRYMILKRRLEESWMNS